MTLPIAARAALLLLLAAPGTAAEPPVPKCGAGDAGMRAGVARYGGLPLLTDDAIPGEARQVVCRDNWCAEFDAVHRLPRWTLEWVGPKVFEGDRNRPKRSFRADPLVAEDGGVSDKHYRNSGFARGHLAPVDDFECSLELMKETFYLSNAVPQVGAGFNSGAWSTLERRLKKRLETRGESAVVISGPVLPRREMGAPAEEPERLDDDCAGAGAVPRWRLTDMGRDAGLVGTLPMKTEICDANDKTAAPDCGGAGVAVPAAMFKVVLRRSKTRKWSMHAWLYDNVSHGERQSAAGGIDAYLRAREVSVATVEELTGIRFFPQLRVAGTPRRNCVRLGLGR